MLIIYNPRAGNASKLSDIRAFCEKHSLRAELVPITHKQLKQKISATQPGEVVVAAGGDGTVSFVASLLAGTKTPLGVLPIGTLNHFAKDLGIPTVVGEAMQMLLIGKPTAVDTARVNSRLFINNSSIGLYPRSLRIREKHQESLGKWPAAIVGIWKVITRPRRYHVELTAHGNVRTFRTPFVFIGNNAYNLAPTGFTNRTSLTEGNLAVYVIKTHNPVRIMALFIAALFSNKRRTKDFEMFLVRQCIIRTRRKRGIAVAHDGEVSSMRPPLRYTSLPGNLSVITPAKTSNK
ncbi:MAG TPA: diacylglycerol kinase family protein [Candidatus Saccharimonadales bacterium]|nr:diacylglycerol kinase family protein [Candidatus Saccharimonadales bacterium]